MIVPTCINQTNSTLYIIEQLSVILFYTKRQSNASWIARSHAIASVYPPAFSELEAPRIYLRYLKKKDKYLKSPLQMKKKKHNYILKYQRMSFFHPLNTFRLKHIFTFWNFYFMSI